jgi:hypothetical protein
MPLTFSERGPDADVGSRPKFILVNTYVDDSVKISLSEHDGEFSFSGPKLGEITLNSFARRELAKYLS